MGGLRGRQFDVEAPFWVTEEYAASRIQSGWIGQYLSDTFVSRLIRNSTQGVHSHSAMFLKNGGGKIDVLELREFKGGQRRTLAYHLSQPQRIDVFAPDTVRWSEFDGDGAATAMRRLTDHEYGWFGIWRMAARRTPFLWRLYPPTTNDQLPVDGKPIRQPFCSHAVSLATHLGGRVDPVPRCPHYLVTPTMLTYSLFYKYQFTIAGQHAGGEAVATAALNSERLNAH